MSTYKNHCKFFFTVFFFVLTQSTLAQDIEVDSLPVRPGMETLVKLASALDHTQLENSPNSSNYKISGQGSSSLTIKTMNTFAAGESAGTLDVYMQKAGVHKFILFYKKDGGPKDFEFDYSNKESDNEIVSDNVILMPANGEMPNLKSQQDPIPYNTPAALNELTAKYAKFKLGAYPPGQILNLADKEMNRPLCEQLMLAKPTLNLLYSNNSINISLVCQGISFSGNNAYMRILIQNSGQTEFLTGVMKLTWVRKSGQPLVLYPGYIFRSQLPIVQPGSQITIIYPFKAFNISDQEQLKFELHDRPGKLNVEITIPGSDYNRERSRENL